MVATKGLEGRTDTSIQSVARLKPIEFQSGPGPRIQDSRIFPADLES